MSIIETSSKAEDKVTKAVEKAAERVLTDAEKRLQKLRESLGVGNVAVGGVTTKNGPATEDKTGGKRGKNKGAGGGSESGSQSGTQSGSQSGSRSSTQSNTQSGTQYRSSKLEKEEKLNESPRPSEAPIIYDSSTPRRVSPDWISAYMEFNRHSESADVFHFWTAISTISGALRRRVWLDQGIFRVYPYLYTVLIGESGSGKTAAAEIGQRDFLRKIPNVRVHSGSITCSSIYKLLNESFVQMGQASESFGAVYIDASSELTFALHSGSERIRNIRMLMEMYDGKGFADYATRAHGAERIDNACITLHGSSTPEGVAEILSLDQLGNGFTGRILWVFSDERKPEQARPKKRSEALYADLLHDIRVIASLRGEFTWSDAGGEMYDDWYGNRLKEFPRRKVGGIRTKYESEYYGRKRTYVLKLAEIFSASQGNSLVLEAEHIFLALTALEHLERDMWRSFKYVGTDLHRLATEIVDVLERGLREAVAAGREDGWQGVSLTHLNASFQSRAKKKGDVKDALEMLEEAGKVVRVMADRWVGYKPVVG